MEDVVIVGAGPAGLACAWRLAQAGLSPLVLEAASFPRDKVCGDALSGKVAAVLRQLGGMSLLRQMAEQPFVGRVSALVFVNERGEALRLEIPPTEWGFTARRYVWDAWLWQQVPAGIRLRTACSVGLIERNEKSWVLHLSHGERILARYLVGADGVASRVRPCVYAFRRRLRPPVYTAIRHYAPYPVGEGELRLNYVPPYLPGYWWAFSMADGLANVGIGGPPRNARRVSFRNALRQLLNLSSGASLPGHGLPVYRQSMPLVAPGCALIGDAGHLVDPFTGEGIGNALLSGYRLAEKLARVPPSHLFNWDGLAYEEALHRELAPEMRVSSLLHRLAHIPLAVRWLLRKLSQDTRLRREVEQMLFKPTYRSVLYSPGFLWRLIA